MAECDHCNKEVSPTAQRACKQPYCPQRAANDHMEWMESNVRGLASEQHPEFPDSQSDD